MIGGLDGPSGPSEDFTDLHAWTEVFLPGAGWVGLDPTSGLLTGEGHIPLAATPNPGAAAPISGTVDECKTEFSFQMSLQRVHEDPRVTKPYTDDQWHSINTGQEVGNPDFQPIFGVPGEDINVSRVWNQDWNLAKPYKHV